MSPTYLVFGTSAVKSRISRSGTTWLDGSGIVVRTRLRSRTPARWWAQGLDPEWWTRALPEWVVIDRAGQAGMTVIRCPTADRTLVRAVRRKPSGPAGRHDERSNDDRQSSPWCRSCPRRPSAALVGIHGYGRSHLR